MYLIAPFFFFLPSLMISEQNSANKSCLFGRGQRLMWLSTSAVNSTNHIADVPSHQKTEVYKLVFAVGMREHFKGS